MDIDPQEQGLKYAPAPSRRPEFDRQLKKIVPECPTGEPYLRFVWGMDQTEILDGRILHRYPDPDGKYVGLERWVLEGWQSSDVYDEAQWRANEEVLGPFPANGVWDFIAVVETGDKQFLNLNEHALQMARNWRHWQSKGRERALEDLIADRCKIQVLKESRWKERKDEILNKFVKDFSRAERGGYDPRKRTLIGKITKGEFEASPTGMLIPKLT